MYLVMKSVLKWRHCVCQTSRCILLPKSHLTKIQSTQYSYKTRKTTLFLFYNDQWHQKQIEGGGGGLNLLKKSWQAKTRRPTCLSGHPSNKPCYTYSHCYSRGSNLGRSAVKSKCIVHCATWTSSKITLYNLWWYKRIILWVHSTCTYIRSWRPTNKCVWRDLDGGTYVCYRSHLNISSLYVL